MCWSLLRPVHPLQSAVARLHAGSPHQVGAVFCGTVRTHEVWQSLKDSSAGFRCCDMNIFSEWGSSFELGVDS